MGGKGSAPSAPDYTPLAMSSAAAAASAQQTSREQLDWAKQQYADISPYTKAYMQSMTDASNENLTNAREAEDFYKGTFRPIESKFAAEAQAYNTPERAAQNAAAAQADVANAFEGNRKAALQSLESYGLDPSQTRYGALDLGMRISQAAAQAAVGTQSRLNTEATGRALEGEAINIGRGYPGQVAQSYATAQNTGGAGISAGNQTFATGSNAMGTPLGWAGAANQGIATSGNLLNQQFNNQLGSANAQNALATQSSAGIGGLVGAAGMAAALYF